MFSYFDPKIVEFSMKNNLKKTRKPSEDFDTYFNKKYLEEAKVYLENPKFSYKYFLFLSHIRQNILEKSKKEYIEKYNLENNFFDKNKKI